MSILLNFSQKYKNVLIETNICWHFFPFIRYLINKRSYNGTGGQLILYAHDEVTYNCHAGTVARELLVSHLCIVLLRLYELEVEVKVVRRSCHEPTCVHEHLHQQTVQFCSCIEMVVLSRVRSIGRVGAAQLGDSHENCVRAARAKSGMKREMGHQMARHILHTVAATEVDT